MLAEAGQVGHTVHDGLSAVFLGDLGSAIVEGSAGGSAGGGGGGGCGGCGGNSIEGGGGTEEGDARGDGATASEMEAKWGSGALG